MWSLQLSIEQSEKAVNETAYVRWRLGVPILVPAGCYSCNNT